MIAVTASIYNGRLMIVGDVDSCTVEYDANGATLSVTTVDCTYFDCDYDDDPIGRAFFSWLLMEEPTQMPESFYLRRPKRLIFKSAQIRAETRLKYDKKENCSKKPGLVRVRGPRRMFRVA